MTGRKKFITSPKSNSGNRRSFDLSSPITVMSLAFIIGLVVRVVYILSFRRSPFFDGLIVDAQWHDEWAWGWAVGTWDMGGRAFFRAPLYPFWLSLIYRVFGHDLTAVRIVQAILGGSTAAALAGCGWRIGGRNAALWAGAIASLYGPLVFFDAELLIPNLLVALLAWSLFFLLAPPSRGAYPTAASLLGLAAIARPSALVLLPAVLYFIWSRIKTERLPRKPLFIWVLLAALLPGAFITILNAREEKTFVFVASQGGVNLYAGNHPRASGRTVEITELGDIQRGWGNFVEASNRVAQQEKGKPLSSRQVSDYWAKKAWDWIAARPGEAAALTLKKAYYVLNAYETPNNRDLYFNRPFPLSLLLWKVPWFAFPWGLIFPLAVVGAIAGLRIRELKSQIALLIGWVFLYGLFIVPFFVTARFRMGMIPALIPLAALALSRARKAFHAIPLAAGIAVLVFVNTGLFQVRSYNPAQELAKLGAALLLTDRLEESRRALGAALEAEPASAEYAYLLGQVYFLEGNKNEALRLFRRSLNTGSTNYRLLIDMADPLMQMKCYTEAAAALERAADLRPADGDVWAGLGRIYENTGQAERAVEAYHRSIRSAPDNQQGYINLGSLYQQQGKLPLAITVWQQGAGRIPGSFALHFNLALAYAQSGRFEAALGEIEAALRIEPDRPDALRIRTMLEQQIERIEKGIAP